MPNINFEVEEELHKNFKILCIREGIDIKDKLVAMIKKEVK